MKALRPRDRRIPRRPFLWLAAALLFTLPPAFGALAPWVPGLFLLTLAAKFFMEPKGYRLRSVIWKLLFAGVALAAVFGSYGSVMGIGPGVSVIVILMSLKIVEAHTSREFQVMVLISWVLCLCGFILSQDLRVALFLGVAFVLLLVALIQFHGGLNSAILPPLRTAGKLLLQGLPLMALLFFLFPRITTGFRLQISPSQSGVSGFSDRLSPGSVSSLINSSEVAFRVEFPDGNIPPPDKLYWRGNVMWQGEGLAWRASEAPAALPRTSWPPPGGAAVRQRITIEAHGGHWLFALDWPAEPPSGVILAPGNYLWSAQPIRKPRRYEVRSFPEMREKELRPRERDMLLALPNSISRNARDLVQSWQADNASPSAIVAHALQFFRTQRFRYSLTPGEYKNNDLDEFLFHRRVGFCEHYAASFATLMRIAGIPARVVTGYLGGEYNEFGRFFLVRQSDAHAWCEVWLPESGWHRVDPTSVVAPDRVTLGLNAFLQNGAASDRVNNQRNALLGGLKNWRVFKDVRLAWQTLNYAWDTRVLSFDGDAQESLLAAIGLNARGPILLLIAILLIVAVALGCYGGWMRWRSRPVADKIGKLYATFCRTAARLGAPRHPAEGPLHFAERAARMLPNESARIKNIATAYIGLRYSAYPMAPLLDQLAEEVKAFAQVATKS